MAQVCRFHVAGCCRFGQLCRNLHPTSHLLQSRDTSSSSSALPHQAPAATRGSGFDDPSSVLGPCWDHIMWKGSPVWSKDAVEPLFRSLDMSMEEVRWEFYQLPMQDWPKLQQMIDQRIEAERQDWLRQHRQTPIEKPASTFMTAAQAAQQQQHITTTTPFSSMQQNPFGSQPQPQPQPQQQPQPQPQPQQQPQPQPSLFLDQSRSIVPPSSNVFAHFPFQLTAPQPNAFHDVLNQPHASTAQDSSLPLSLFGQPQQPGSIPQLQQPNAVGSSPSVPLFSSASSVFSQCLPQSGQGGDVRLSSSVIRTASVTAPILSQPPGQLSFATPSATVKSGSHDDGHQTCYQHFYPQADELKQRYAVELNDYELWEIAAFLSPEFHSGRIPTKAPPQLPEFL